MTKKKVVGGAEAGAKPATPAKAEKGIKVADANGVVVRTFPVKEKAKAEHYAEVIGGRVLAK